MFVKRFPQVFVENFLLGYSCSWQLGPSRGSFHPLEVFTHFVDVNIILLCELFHDVFCRVVERKIVAEIIPQIVEVNVVVLIGEFLHGLHLVVLLWLLASLDGISISHLVSIVNSFLYFFLIYFALINTIKQSSILHSPLTEAVQAIAEGVQIAFIIEGCTEQEHIAIVTEGRKHPHRVVFYTYTKKAVAVACDVPGIGIAYIVPDRPHTRQSKIDTDQGLNNSFHRDQSFPLG